MSELAAILARRRAKNGEAAAEVEAPAIEQASPPKPVRAPTEEPAAEHSEEPNARRTSSRIAQLQGNLASLNMNAFRPMPMPRKSTASSIVSTGEDYDYERTMKVGMAMPGMAGVPMIGLTKPGIGLPGMMKQPSNEDSSPAPEEPTPAPVLHTTMTRATGPKRRAPTKPRAEVSATGTSTSEAVVETSSTTPLITPEPQGSLFGQSTSETPSSTNLFGHEAVPSPVVPAPVPLPQAPAPVPLPQSAVALPQPPRTNKYLFGPGKVDDNMSDSDWSDDDDLKGGLFGTSKPAPAPTQPRQAPLFGQPIQPAAATLHSTPQASLFGQPAPAANLHSAPEPSLFGNASSATLHSAPQASLFGNASTATLHSAPQASLFGNASSATLYSAPKPSLFGKAPAVREDSHESLFGNTSHSSSSLFGAPKPSSVPTSNPKPYQPRPNLFEVEGSDEEDDDGGGLFGTGLPRK
ncbi:hypothetical protein THRCLA_02564 [Thraustotheca clavata]|uniref:Uncharacterized protein n=1 Tax=Thraustotheca clavata TaxID=74557 RepID=A0A1W0A4W1_9STRA|nr:hypothetical protein THRCLA_02564 [Thraustotheca clavata]